MIVLEDLAVTNMIRNRSRAKAIADCGRGTFRAMTAYSGSSRARSAVKQEPQGVSPESPSSRAQSSQGFSTGPGGQLETAELRDTLSYATLHMMERLSPPERAVFVLREAFGLPYQQIAPVVQASPATHPRPSTPPWLHVSSWPLRVSTWMG